jgi:4'-phosphopantetheinyl transferase
MRERPARGRVDVVFVEDIAPAAEAFEITDDEEDVAGRFATERLRRRSRGARGLLRHVAAGYLGCRPLDVPIAVAPCPSCGGPHGKPELAVSGLHANVSYTGDAAAVAIATAEVGIDVERSGRVGDAVALARQFYAPQEARWVAGNEGQHEARYLRLWVRKEALLKATGEGLAGGLDAPLLGPMPATVARGLPCGPGRWTVADLDPRIGIVGAVALAGVVCEPRLIDLSELE